MSELMCSQSKCRRKDEHIAELEADNRRLSEIEQRRISEAITQADNIAILRGQMAELREAARDEVEMMKAVTPEGKALPVATHKLAALLQGEGNE